MSTLVSKTCGHCDRAIPLSIQVGDRCPHCGVRFGGERTTTTTTVIRSGSGSSSDDFPFALPPLFAGLIGVICLLALLGPMAWMALGEPGTFGEHPVLFVLVPLSWTISIGVGLAALLGSVGAMEEGDFDPRRFIGPFALCFGFFQTLFSFAFPIFLSRDQGLLPVARFLDFETSFVSLLGMPVISLLLALVPAWCFLVGAALMDNLRGSKACWGASWGGIGGLAFSVASVLLAKRIALCDGEAPGWFGGAILFSPCCLGGIAIGLGIDAIRQGEFDRDEVGCHWLFCAGGLGLLLQPGILVAMGSGLNVPRLLAGWVGLGSSDNRLLTAGVLIVCAAVAGWMVALAVRPLSKRLARR